MADPTGYEKQSPYSDPGAYAPLLDDLPTDIAALTSVARNVIVHYRDPSADLPDERLSEINHRWLDRLLATDQARAGAPLTAARPINERVAEIAALLLAADAGDEGTERELAQLYADDPRLHPGDQIESHTPFGEVFKVDLRKRENR